MDKITMWLRFYCSNIGHGMIIHAGPRRHWWYHRWCHLWLGTCTNIHHTINPIPVDRLLCTDLQRSLIEVIFESSWEKYFCVKLLIPSAPTTSFLDFFKPEHTWIRNVHPIDLRQLFLFRFLSRAKIYLETAKRYILSRFVSFSCIISLKGL